jgi:hypothetical protein
MVAFARVRLVVLRLGDSEMERFRCHYRLYGLEPKRYSTTDALLGLSEPVIQFALQQIFHVLRALSLPLVDVKRKFPSQP